MFQTWVCSRVAPGQSYCRALQQSCWVRKSCANRWASGGYSETHVESCHRNSNTDSSGWLSGVCNGLFARLDNKRHDLVLWGYLEA